MELLQYMKDNESTEWAKLKEEWHIDIATHHVWRLSQTLHLAFLLWFALYVTQDERDELFADMSTHDGPELAAKWDMKLQHFLEYGFKRNGIFAVHVHLFKHLDGIIALQLAERLGGADGHNFVFASTKESLAFSFLNGSTSYSPYSVDLLYEH